MSDSRETASVTLATVRMHLSAAEAALTEHTAGDPVAAAELALAELRRATAAHDRFASALGHDLRNSFTTITGQAQLLERSLAKGTLTPDRVQKAVHQINQSIAEANAIVRELSGT